MRIASDDFVVKITGPGMTFQRRVPAERVSRIVSLLLYPGSAPEDSDEASSHEPITVSPRTADNMNPKTFMAEKRPKTDMERVTCLAFYLMRYQGTQHFKTRDLTDLNKEAAQPQLSNPSVAARNAVTHQYLALAGGGSKQITTRGEALVDALPDREKVKAALEHHPMTRRKKSAKAPK
jgi:hypothetical protein